MSLHSNLKKAKPFAIQLYQLNGGSECNLTRPYIYHTFIIEPLEYINTLLFVTRITALLLLLFEFVVVVVVVIYQNLLTSFFLILASHQNE